MRLPLAAEYAIRGIVHIAKCNNDAPVTIRQISAAEAIPQNYLVKIFKSLVAAGLILSRRGKKGGFSLAVDPKTVSMRRVIEAVQGPIFFNACLMGPDHCNHQSWCPGHEVWLQVQKSVCDILDSVSLDAIAAAEAKTGRTRGNGHPAHSPERNHKDTKKTKNKEPRINTDKHR